MIWNLSFVLFFQFGRIHSERKAHEPWLCYKIWSLHVGSVGLGQIKRRVPGVVQEWVVRGLNDGDGGGGGEGGPHGLRSIGRRFVRWVESKYG